jgi:hypothetical protein
MGSSKTLDISESVLASLLSDENFAPARPATLEETGLGEEFIEQLICKYVRRSRPPLAESLAAHGRRGRRAYDGQ